MKNGLLGNKVDYPSRYQPDLLEPIPRALNREQLGMDDAGLPFHGMDLWNAYEVSWLEESGLPRVAVGRFVFPCVSPNLIESKSLKFYLNSLNHERFEDKDTVERLIARDLSACAGAPVRVELAWLHASGAPGDEFRAIRGPQGESLDTLDVSISTYVPDVGLLALDPAGEGARETLYTELFRSNCPVTGQPDWASISVTYEGPRLLRTGLLSYLVSYRQHSDYHENCVERIFRDIKAACRPESLTVQANFLRRGGLDINPVRTTVNDFDYDNFPRFYRQ